jgi:hypothetical protein
MNADERRWREEGAYASSRVVFGNGPRTAPRLMVFSLQSAFICVICGLILVGFETF